jgi:hypothetical protein
MFSRLAPSHPQEKKKPTTKLLLLKKINYSIHNWVTHFISDFWQATSEFKMACDHQSSSLRGFHFAIKLKTVVQHAKDVQKTQRNKMRKECAS